MKIKYLFFSLVLALLFFACEEDIQLDSLENKKLVLFANFQPDSLFKLSLSTSIPIGSADSLLVQYPSDARIQLFKDGEYLSDFEFVPFTRDQVRPFYTHEHRAEAGAIYSIKAQYQNYPMLSASSTIPTPPQLQAMKVLEWEELNDNTNPDLYFYFGKVKLPLDLPSATTTYYHLLVKQQIIRYNVVGSDTVKNSRIVNLFSRLPKVQRPNLQLEPGHLLESSEIAADNSAIEVDFNFGIDRSFELKGPIYFELRHVTKDYYLFHKSREEQDLANSQQSILYNDPVLIHNNIEGGIGLFSGYQASTKRLTW